MAAFPTTNPWTARERPAVTVARVGALRAHARRAWALRAHATRADARGRAASACSSTSLASSFLGVQPSRTCRIARLDHAWVAGKSNNWHMSKHAHVIHICGQALTIDSIDKHALMHVRLVRTCVRKQPANQHKRSVAARRRKSSRDEERRQNSDKMTCETRAQSEHDGYGCHQHVERASAQQVVQS